MKDWPNIVLLTGAGVSAESGIKTFRDQGGLWENHDILEVASPEGFRTNPDLVHRFYNDRVASLDRPEVRPNLAHEAIAKLQKEYQGEVFLITQNVDDLHERAQSPQVLHMHGELRKMRCQRTGEIFPMVKNLSTQTRCECCKETQGLRPHIVWFGEVPFGLDEIEKKLVEAQVFIAVGTSGQVYPAAMFVQIAKLNGECFTVEVNLDPASNSSAFDYHLHGPASLEIPKLVQSCLDGSLFSPKNNQS